MKIDASKTTFVFDLDDTLYKEHDYYLSGINAVSVKLNSIYGINIKKCLGVIYDNKNNDSWLALCKQLELPNTVAESIKWEYRLHQPSISLDSNVKKLLDWLVRRSIEVAILTDGRSVTQRSKINALGLADIPIYISEEYGSIKPDLKRFEIIQMQHPNSHYIYIGDNPAKDFLAPNKLGWITIGLIGNDKNIYPQKNLNLSPDYLPDIWVSELSELKGLLC